jgi:hypothetical protein
LRQHFFREWEEDDILKIIFTPTLHNTADIFTKNTTEEIFQTHSVILVKPIPNQIEMGHFTSANYEDLVIKNEQNDWISVAKQIQKCKQTGKFWTAKQEGKLSHLLVNSSHLHLHQQQIIDIFALEKKPLATCKCCGVKGHVANDCNSRLGADITQWRQIRYHKPGDKPLTRNKQQRIWRSEDQIEAEALEINLGFQAYGPNFPPPDPFILQPVLHVKPNYLCYEFGHTTIDFPELFPLCIKTGDCNHIMAGPSMERSSRLFFC